MVQYTVMCAILGDKDKEAFSVKIDSNEPVSELKNQIKQANPTTLASCEARALKLYKIHIPVSDTPTYNTLIDSISRLELVSPFCKLSAIQGGVPEDNLHILVEVPAATSSAPKRKRSADPPVVAGLAPKRRRVPCGHVPPSMFENCRTHYDLNPSLFATNMPPRFDLIPFALLHPAFAKFDDAEIMPDDQDVHLVRELQTKMTRNWNTELNKCDEFRSILAMHYKDIVLLPAHVGGTAHISDGHFDQNGLLLTVLQGGPENGDAQVQGSMYALTALREKLEELDLLSHPFPFPCIIITLTGNNVGFCGTVFTSRFELEVLTPRFSLHPNLWKDVMPLARAFKAFRLAFSTLREEYRDLFAVQPRDLPPANSADFPYPHHYDDETGEKVSFTYDKRFDDSRLMFLATAPAKELRLFIKFTRQYGRDAHRACSDERIAPHLYDVVSLPGGWYMVVMEYLDPSAFRHCDIRLETEVRNAVGILHDRGFVHGDLRDCNMMCTREGGARRVLLLDFDWAGRTGEVRYPVELNIKTVRRPAGVCGGGIIQTEDDNAMVNFLFP